MRSFSTVFQRLSETKTLLDSFLLERLIRVLTFPSILCLVRISKSLSRRIATKPRLFLTPTTFILMNLYLLLLQSDHFQKSVKRICGVLSIGVEMTQLFLLRPNLTKLLSLRSNLIKRASVLVLCHSHLKGQVLGQFLLQVVSLQITACNKQSLLQIVRNQ